MKTIHLLIVLFALSSVSAAGQKSISAGLGFVGESINAHGIVLEIERDKLYSEGASLPTRLNLIFQNTEDYFTSSIDIHKGFRRNFSSGFVFEQSVGFGYIIKSYKEKSYWYRGELGENIPHGNKPVGSVLPSVTIGAGYNFSTDKGGYDYLWIRPKVYWELASRTLNTPYFSVQAGFTHTIKTK